MKRLALMPSALILIFTLAGQVQSQSNCPGWAWHGVVAKGTQTSEVVTGGKLPDGRSLVLVKFEGQGEYWHKHSAVFLIKDGCYLGAVVVALIGTITDKTGTPLYTIDYYEPDHNSIHSVRGDPPSLKQVWEIGQSLLAKPPQ